MVILSDPQLEQVSHADLIAMVRARFVRVDTLEKENQKSREIERLKHPKADSQNSSQPLTSDQNTNNPSGKQKWNHLTPSPDRVILLVVNQCESSQHDLSATESSKVVLRRITELAEIKTIVPEMHQARKVCPNCQHLNRSALSEGSDGLEADRYFGPQLEASVVFFKHQDHFSLERIVDALRKIFGLQISGGGMATIIARAGKLASECAAKIRQAVISSPIIQSGETSGLVKGQNHWYRTLSSQAGEYCQIILGQVKKLSVI